MNARWKSRLVAAMVIGALVAIGCSSNNNNGGPGPTRKMHVGIIHLVAGEKLPIPRKQHASKSDSLLDHVRWSNETANVETLTFTGVWPFMERSEPIVISAGKLSPWYTMNSAVVQVGVEYDYHVEPPTFTSTGPGPGEPSITGDP